MKSKGNASLDLLKLSYRPLRSVSSNTMYFNLCFLHELIIGFNNKFSPLSPLLKYAELTNVTS